MHFFAEAMKPLTEEEKEVFVELYPGGVFRWCTHCLEDLKKNY